MSKSIRKAQMCGEFVCMHTAHGKQQRTANANWYTALFKDACLHFKIEGNEQKTVSLSLSLASMPQNRENGVANKQTE